MSLMEKQLLFSALFITIISNTYSPAGLDSCSQETEPCTEDSDCCSGLACPKAPLPSSAKFCFAKKQQEISESCWDPRHCRDPLDCFARPYKRGKIWKSWVNDQPRCWPKKYKPSNFTFKKFISKNELQRIYNLTRDYQKNIWAKIYNKTLEMANQTAQMTKYAAQQTYDTLKDPGATFKKYNVSFSGAGMTSFNNITFDFMKDPGKKTSETNNGNNGNKTQKPNSNEKKSSHSFF